jgi:hypothetical protein
MSAEIEPIEIQNLNVNNIRFDEPQEKYTPDKISYYSSVIKVRTASGAMTDLYLVLPKCPSYGLSDKYAHDEKTGAVDIGKISLSLTFGRSHSEYGTDSEIYKQAVQSMENLVKACKKFILTDEVKNKIGKYDLEENDLKSFNPLKYKRDDKTKKLRFDVPPSVYLKPIVLNKKSKDKKDSTDEKVIMTKFFIGDSDDEFPSWQSLIGKAGTAQCVLKVERIYFGKDISLQIKLFQVAYVANMDPFKQLNLTKRFRSPLEEVSGPDSKSLYSAKKSATTSDFADEEDAADNMDIDEQERPSLLNEDEDVDEQAAEDEEPVRPRTPSPPPTPLKVDAPSKTVRRNVKKN